MLRRTHWKFWAPIMLLGFLWIGLPLDVQAGDKLKKLKEDVLRIQKGTLLLAPILPDSFVLGKFDGSGGLEKRAAYFASLATGTTNLIAAIKKHYHFSRVEVLPAFKDYPSYHAALKTYNDQSYFVLQFGHMAQFAATKSKKVSQYDKGFLGIYALDAQSKMYLNQGKLPLFKDARYAESIVKNLQLNLDKYAKPRGKKTAGPRLLSDKVALLPQERLFGNDSLTFLDGQYQTVVTIQPLKAYRAFGGVSMPGGTFVTIDSIADTSLTRRDLAILMAWGNTLEFEAVIAIPVATKINMGRAAPQGDLKGGGIQVIMPYKWPQEWITRIYHTRSNRSWTLEEFRAAYPAYFPTK